MVGPMRSEASDMSELPPSPYISVDGRWWWDGSRWMPMRRIPAAWRFPRELVGPVVMWLGYLSAVPILWFSQTGSTQLSDAEIRKLAVVSVVAACTTILPGVLIGVLQHWKLLPIVAAAGTGVLCVFYVAGMLAQEDPAGTNDIAAGAGVIVLGLPAFAAINLLLAAGAGLGGVVRKLSRAPLQH